MTLPVGQPFALQNSPATLAFYLPISRGTAYPLIDMTNITSVVVVVRFPDARTVQTWTLTPVPSLSTAARGVFTRMFDPSIGDTAQLGNYELIATPYIGSTALPPATGSLPVRAPSLG